MDKAFYYDEIDKCLQSGSQDCIEKLRHELFGIIINEDKKDSYGMTSGRMLLNYLNTKDQQSKLKVVRIKSEIDRILNK